MCKHMGVSKNNGTPQIIQFNRVFHDFHHPFWGFSPYFWETPISQSESLELMFIVFKVWRVKLTLWLFCTGPRVWRTYTETYDMYETSHLYIYIFVVDIHYYKAHICIHKSCLLVDQMDGTNGISILTLRVSSLTFKIPPR